jgi:ABC-type transport system involved in cytochrome c biogenesis permease subunit
MSIDSAMVMRIVVPLLYAVTSVGYIAAVMRDKTEPPAWTQPVLWCGIILHSLLLVMLVVSGRVFPLITVFKGLLFCGWLLAVFMLSARRHFAEPAYGAFLFPLTFAVTLVAAAFLNRGTPLPPAMQSYYYVAHASALFCAYSCFFYSSVVSVMFLRQHRTLRSGARASVFRRLPSLESMDQTIWRADALGLMLLLVGMALGFLWAFWAMGSAEHLTMKIGFAVLTAVVYCSEHVLRFSKGWNGQRAALVSLLGFVLVICTLLAGSHGF